MSVSFFFLFGRGMLPPIALVTPRGEPAVDLGHYRDIRMAELPRQSSYGVPARIARIA
jgi:hypothetical protein